MESAQTMLRPESFNSGVTGWTMSRRTPSSCGFLAVAQTRPTTRPRNMGVAWSELWGRLPTRLPQSAHRRMPPIGNRRAGWQPAPQRPQAPVSLLIVQLQAIDDADNGGVYRRVLAAFGHAGGTS